MSRENADVVPTPFRGLRVLLVDNDTASLLNIAKELEIFSYRVTTTEIATVALSILQERKDRFDLIMADTNMPEMDCFKFIKSVQLVKDFPIILMSSELNKDMVKEAIVKGASFFLKKPISSKNLKNVWQHVFRQSKYKNTTDSKQEADSKGTNVENDEKALDQTENGYDDKKLTGIPEKRPMPVENVEHGESKRRKTENDDGLKLKGVIDAKGKGEARPESALEMTKETNLTRRHFSRSCQQKYRVEPSNTKLNEATSLPSVRTKIFETSSNSNSFNPYISPWSWQHGNTSERAESFRSVGRFT